MTPTFNFKFKAETIENLNSHSELISRLFQARTQLHIWHLQVEGVGSYATHKALDEFYSDIVGLTDGIAETIQGKIKSIIKGYVNFPIEDFSSNEQVLSYLSTLKSYVESYMNSLLPGWSNIENQLQAVVDLIESTIYKLNFLK